jgi:hypothetical protein
MEAANLNLQQRDQIRDEIGSGAAQAFEEFLEG